MKEKPTHHLWTISAALIFTATGCGLFSSEECKHRPIYGYAFDAANQCFPRPDEELLLACLPDQHQEVFFPTGDYCRYSPATGIVARVPHRDLFWADANGYEEDCYPNYLHTFPWTAEQRAALSCDETD
jgi:hypothetical protein